MSSAAVVRSLSGDRAFRRLRKGQSGSSKHVTIRWRPTGEDEVRVGIVVSRKVGKAVVRNRVRRRLREGLRELLTGNLAHRSFDLMIIARPSAADASYHQLTSSLRTALKRGALLK